VLVAFYTVMLSHRVLYKVDRIHYCFSVRSKCSLYLLKYSASRKIFQKKTKDRYSCYARNSIVTNVAGYGLKFRGSRPGEDILIFQVLSGTRSVLYSEDTSI
jgi:hypothetical protein